MSAHLHVVIMAGGAGVRFWPMSTQQRPKQFLDILGVGSSLLQTTYQRAAQCTARERIWVVTSAAYAGLVYEQLPDIPRSNVLLEPKRCNTAPCLALAAACLLRVDPDALMLVVPSDHLITHEARYFEAVEQGVAFARGHDALLTFGIAPQRPETGFGYIEVLPDTSARDGQIVPVKCFREKPDYETACRFVADGAHYWNGGIFLWRAESLQAALAQHAPDVHAAFAQVRETPPGEALAQAIDEAYGRTPVISIDYAVLERARNVYVMPTRFGWSDLGSWGAVAEHHPRDAQGNALMGGVVAPDTRNTLVRLPKGRVAYVEGLDGYLVALTEEALLICPMARSQAIRDVVEQLQQEGLGRYT